MSRSSVVFCRLADLILRRRAAFAGLLVALTAFFLWQIPQLRFDNSNEVWFAEGDPALERINALHKLFGNDDFIYLVFDADALFSPQSLHLLADLARDIRQQVPYLRDLTWLGNAERIEANAEGITVTDFIAPGNYDSANMAELRQQALNERNYRNSLISEDGKTVGIILEMQAYHTGNEDARLKVTQALRSVLAQPQYAHLKMHIVGQPVLHTDYDRISFQESATFFGLCLLVQMVLLFWLGKGLRSVIAPIGVVVLAVIWTLGMIQLLGFTLNLFIILLPTLMICVCIGDSMHMIATFNQESPNAPSVGAALCRTLASAGLPCLLTSLTTAAGFLGFCTTGIRPFREMGVYAALGTMIAFILSVLVVLIIFGGKRKTAVPVSAQPAPPARPDFFDRLLHGIYRINIRFPKTLLMLFAVLFAASLYGYGRIEVESNTARMLSPALALRQAYDFVDTHMGGSMSVEILLDTGRENGVKSQEFLRGLERLQQHLDEEPVVTKTVSVLNILKTINEAMHDGNPAAYAVPAGTDETIAQYLLFYEMANGRELDKVVSFDSRVARLTARTRTIGTRDVRHLAREVEAFSQTVFGDKVKVSMAGHLDWVRSMNDLLASGQSQSFLTALLLVSAIMCLALGSLRLGILSMLPNVFPVFITLGLMGMAGIYMDMPLMSFSALIIGVVVDDTIHFLFHYREAFARSGSYEQALEATLHTTGRPLLFTTLTMVCGFSVLLFSHVLGVMKFGGLGCFAFAWALLADLFLVPAILLTFHPLKAPRSAQQTLSSKPSGVLSL